MATLQDQNAFFREGLLRYADARETVNYFQTCVQEAIARAFESKTVWKHFQPLRVEPEQSLETGKGMGVVFIHAYVAGTVPNRNVTAKVWLSLGLYWNPPLRPSSVVAASHCWIDGGGPWVPFNLRTSSNGIGCGPLYKRNERRLLLTANEGFDPELSFGVLLDVADEALGPLDQSTPPVQSAPSN